MPIASRRFVPPLDAARVAADWRARGYSCQPFADPPGRQWNDFVHEANELLTVLEGRLKLIVEGREAFLEPGDEAFIAKGERHSVHNAHGGVTRWLYGYD
jgi:mannose-6-phosphate isomerase-like protein (cupin superfamily)